MLNILKKFIIISSLFSGVSFLTACSLFQSRSEKKSIHYEFAQGSYFVSISEYEKAEPYLLHTIAREDENYMATLLLLGKVYDQLSMPEKSILNLKDFLSRGSGPMDRLKAQALLIKNLAKVKVDIENADEKKSITRLVTTSIDPMIALEELRWTMDFNCALYCVEEVLFLKEIQVQILYIIERDPNLYKRAFDVLTSRYDFFENALKESPLDLEHRKNIARGLYDALQKLKSSHLENNTMGSIKTAEMVLFLNSYQKRIEQWLYDK